MGIFGNTSVSQFSPLTAVAETFRFYFVQHCGAADKKGSRWIYVRELNYHSIS